MDKFNLFSFFPEKKESLGTREGAHLMDIYLLE